MKRLKHMTAQFRTALVALVIVFIIIICALMVVGCDGNDDDDAMPCLTAIFAEALTDHDGRIRTLRDDYGRLLNITNLDTTAVGRNTPDSLYRVKAWIVPDSDAGHVKVAQLEWLFSYIPQSSRDTQVKHDPVESVSAAITPRYINIRLTIRGNRMQDHRFRFIEESILAAPDGTKTLTISLHHDSNGDAPNYAEAAVFSCPIYPYADILTPGRDKVRFVAHTKGEPFVQEWVFPKAANQRKAEYRRTLPSSE